MILSRDFGRESLYQQEAGDFQAWVEIAAYFDADALYSYVFCQVPVYDQYFVINPYVRDIMLHRSRNLRLIHPDTMYMMVRWAIVREGLGAGKITYNLSRYLRQITGINWGRFVVWLRKKDNQHSLFPN